MTLKLTKEYRRRKTKKALSELVLYRDSREYYTKLTMLPNLSMRKMMTARSRLQNIETVIAGIEQALTRLSPIERKIIELHYAEEQMFEEIGDIVHLERSSVYRYHNLAIDKIATVLYGVEEEV